MITQEVIQNTDIKNQWKSIYFIGAIATIVALAGILLDVIMGNMTGGNLSELPQTAIDRFFELQDSTLFGLYNLDLLNIMNQLILIPAYFALFAAHRPFKTAPALLALIVFLVGTVIYIENNAALSMLELSHKYATSTSEIQKLLLAAAGESMLVRGAHGSLGGFIGSILPNIAGIMMSIVMLQGKVFSKINAYLGIVGSFLMVVYFILVTFVPSIKNMATAIAMPCGLMAMTWMILFTIRLFKLSRIESEDI